MLLFSAPRLAVPDLQIMMVQVATVAGVVLEIIGSVPGVELYVMWSVAGLAFVV